MRRLQLSMACLLCSFFVLAYFWGFRRASGGAAAEFNGNEKVAVVEHHGALRRENSPTCNFLHVDKLDADDYIDFHEKYLKSATKPIVIRNAVANLDAWSKRHHMQSFQDMASAYGDAVLRSSPRQTLQQLVTRIAIAERDSSVPRVAHFNAERLHEEFLKVWVATNMSTANDHNPASFYADFPLPSIFRNRQTVEACSRAELKHVRRL